MLGTTKFAVITTDRRGIVCNPGEALVGYNVRSLQISGDRVGVLSESSLYVSEGWPPTNDSSCELQRMDVYSFQIEGDRIAVLTFHGELFIKEGPVSEGNWTLLTSDVLSYQLEDRRIGVLTNAGLLLEKIDIHAPWVEVLTPYSNYSYRSFQLYGNRGSAMRKDFDALDIWEHNPDSIEIGRDERGRAKFWEQIANLVSYQLTDNRLGVLTKNGKLWVNEGAGSNKLVEVAKGVTAFQLERDHIGYLNQSNQLFVKRGALDAVWTQMGNRVDSFQLQTDGNEVRIMASEELFLYSATSLDSYLKFDGWWFPSEIGRIADFSIMDGSPVGRERQKSRTGAPFLFGTDVSGDMLVCGPPPCKAAQGANYLGGWYNIYAVNLTQGRHYCWALSVLHEAQGSRHMMCISPSPNQESDVPVELMEEWLFRLKDGPWSDGATSKGSNPAVLSFTPPVRDVHMFGSPEPSRTYYLHVWTYSADEYWVAWGAYKLFYPASPFVLGIHSYSFPNYEGEADEALFREVFGLGADPLNRTQKEYFDNIFTKNYGGGQCYGMAVTAGMFYRGIYGPKPNDLQSGAATVHQLVQDKRIERHIAKYFYYQFAPDRYSATETLRDVQAAHAIDQRLQDGWHDPFVLHYNVGFGTGHAVNIIGLHPDFSPGSVSIAVYDNNRETEVCWISLGKPLPGVPDYFEKKDYVNCIPTSIHEKDHIPLPYSSSGGAGSIGISLALDPSLKILHIDQQGRRLGTLSTGQEVAEIPGGRRIIPCTGNVNPSWQPPVEYYLPAGEAYTIELRKPEKGAFGYDLFEGDTLLKLTTTAPSRTAVSRLKTQPTGRRFSFFTQKTRQPVTAKIFLDSAGAPSRIFEITYTTLHRDQELTASTSEHGDALHLELQGRYHDPYYLPYTLTLQKVEAHSTLSTCLEDLAIQKGTFQAVELWDWSRLNSMPIFIKTTKANGIVSVSARQADPGNTVQLLNEMHSRGHISRRATLDSILLQIRTRTNRTIRGNLMKFGAEGVIAPDTAERIYAAVVASRLSA
jgi:hypothetical protein